MTNANSFSASRWHFRNGRNTAVSLVTTVNKAEQHLTLKLAVLIFDQLNHSLLKCKLYLNLHFAKAPPEISPPISTCNACFLPALLPAQISTAPLGCILPSWGHIWIEMCMCRLCEKNVFHTRSGNWTTLEYVDVIIHIMRFGPYKLREFYRRRMYSKHNKYAQWDFFIERLEIQEKYGKIFKRDNSGIEW